jgi:hypothetical protein
LSASRSIKSLYPLALAEGEGVGTAYEYFAKRLVLRPLLRSLTVRRLLVAGLPEKYGSSLDFLLLAEECGAAVTVADERPEALEKLGRSLAAAQALGHLRRVQPRLVALDSGWDGLAGHFDLALSSEVLQRVSADTRTRYTDRLTRIAGAVALFCPNRHNSAHVGISGLDGLTLDELRDIAPWAVQSGYIDMPPFPPGITRSAEQRDHATSGRLEGVAMAGLGLYARLEHWLPTAIRRSQSHIVYAFGRFPTAIA